MLHQLVQILKLCYLYMLDQLIQILKLCYLYMLHQLVQIVKPATLACTVRLQGGSQQRLGGIVVCVCLLFVQFSYNSAVRYRNITMGLECHRPVEHA